MLEFLLLTSWWRALGPVLGSSTVALGWVDVDVDESSSFHYAHHVHYPKWFFWTSAISGNCCAACSRDITFIGNLASNNNKKNNYSFTQTNKNTTHTHTKKKKIFVPVPGIGAERGRRLRKSGIQEEDDQRKHFKHGGTQFKHKNIERDCPL